MRGFETKQLKPVIVGDRRFPVEERSRLYDTEKPPTASNLTVAVYTTVNGELVYCGTSRSGCRAAIIQFLKNPDDSSFQELGGD